MAEHSFDDAVEAFTRINTLGVRLKAEDIQSAKVAARHSGFIADHVIPFLAEVRSGGYDRISVMHLFRACAFIAKPDGRSRTPLHELDDDDVLRAWKKTQRATEQALGIAGSELGLINMDVLWSGALFVPLIALCARLSHSERNVPELVGWLSLAALLHRYSGASDTALDEDLRACRESDPVGALLGNLRQLRTHLCAAEADFQGALNDKNGLLATYIACMHRGIRDFFTDGAIRLQKGIHRHHILPRGQFEKSARSRADNVANIAFITEGVNIAISLSGPEVYLKRIQNRTLQSQCVPLDEKLWSIDRADEFWNARRELLAESFNEFLKQHMPQRRVGQSPT